MLLLMIGGGTNGIVIIANRTI